MSTRPRYTERMNAQIKLPEYRIDAADIRRRGRNRGAAWSCRRYSIRNSAVSREPCHHPSCWRVGDPSPALMHNGRVTMPQMSVSSRCSTVAARNRMLIVLYCNMASTFGRYPRPRPSESIVCRPVNAPALPADSREATAGQRAASRWQGQ